MQAKMMKAMVVKGNQRSKFNGIIIILGWIESFKQIDLLIKEILRHSILMNDEYGTVVEIITKCCKLKNS